MKRLIIFLFLFLASLANAQDLPTHKYENTVYKEIDGIVYEIWTVGHFRSQNRVGFTHLDGWGERKDGQPIEEYETDNIATSAPENTETTYNALRKAFTKEQITENIGLFIQMLFILAPDGTVLETAYVYPYDEKRITPEQIAVFDREISNKLKFTIDPEKADRYVYIPCNIKFGFAYFANYRVEVELPNDGGLTPVDGKPAARP